MIKFVFLKKEIFEILKTPKIIILPAVSLFFGILSPLTAKFINELLKALGAGDTIKIPDPTYIDSYSQFFKNHYGTTAIVMIFVFMGLVAAEKKSGSAILVLTKNLSRTNFVLSKFFAGVLLFTFSYVLSMIPGIYYTYFLFGTYWNDYLPLALLMFWVYGIFMIALMLFSSILAKSSIISALIGFLGYAFVSFASSLPHIGDFSPGIMHAMSLYIMIGDKNVPGDAIYPIVTSLALTIILVTSGILIFRKQEL